MQWSCQFGESFDESSIEVKETNKTSCFGKVLRCFPGGDSLCFDWVHSYPSMANDNSQIFYLHDFEGALLRFDVEVVFFKPV